VATSHSWLSGAQDGAWSASLQDAWGAPSHDDRIRFTALCGFDEDWHSSAGREDELDVGTLAQKVRGLFELISGLAPHQVAPDRAAERSAAPSRLVARRDGCDHCDPSRTLAGEPCRCVQRASARDRAPALDDDAWARAGSRLRQR
jgi:hypothetical protein